ncbi:MAG: acetyltransferase [Prevotellaceae bacterium]|nr:acetyltransferase [Prevotellaceae bacterium]
MYSICKNRHKIDMKVRTRVGYGLNLGHNMCMVINPGTIIGNNCDLSQFLNIGTNHGTPAILGNEVYIGPGVCIVEDARIGSRSTIGAGAVVRGHIAPDSTAVGVPARIVNKTPKPYVRNRWPLPPQAQGN